VSNTAIVDRLAAHRALHEVPRSELEWLAAHGRLKEYKGGDVVITAEMPMEDFGLMILLKGRLSVFVDRGAGRKKIVEWNAGDVTGRMPYSRIQRTIGDVIIDDDSEVFEVPAQHFKELTRECPETTAVLVHAMVDRARMFTSSDWQDEKMMSLGRLAAGLAHELNNPASALSRGAKLLQTTLPQSEEAFLALGGTHLTEEERSLVTQARDRSLVPATTGVFSAIERADREDEMTTWLEDHGADSELGAALAESGVDIAVLDHLADRLNADALPSVIRALAASFTARSLAGDLERASTKIYDLVSAVKRFTYMDRGVELAPINIMQGINDTVAVLASKAKAKSVMIKLDIAHDLPPVRAYGAELNQVWSNLIENALDAVPKGGTIMISATCDAARVCVRIVDDGPGIPPDIKARIFDPFFTTKPIGQGTGLGLDIARRVVQRHEGVIEVDSRPGRTEFSVTLPRWESK